MISCITHIQTAPSHAGFTILSQNCLHFSLGPSMSLLTKHFLPLFYFSALKHVHHSLSPYPTNLCIHIYLKLETTKTMIFVQRQTIIDYFIPLQRNFISPTCFGSVRFNSNCMSTYALIHSLSLSHIGYVWRIRICVPTDAQGACMLDQSSYKHHSASNWQLKLIEFICDNIVHHAIFSIPFIPKVLASTIIISSMTNSVGLHQKKNLSSAHFAAIFQYVNYSLIRYLCRYYLFWFKYLYNI